MSGPLATSCSSVITDLSDVIDSSGEQFIAALRGLGVGLEAPERAGRRAGEPLIVPNAYGTEACTIRE